MLLTIAWTLQRSVSSPCGLSKLSLRRVHLQALAKQEALKALNAPANKVREIRKFTYTHIPPSSNTPPLSSYLYCKCHVREIELTTCSLQEEENEIALAEAAQAALKGRTA